MRTPRLSAPTAREGRVVAILATFQRRGNNPEVAAAESPADPVADPVATYQAVEHACREMDLLCTKSQRMRQAFIQDPPFI